MSDAYAELGELLLDLAELSPPQGADVAEWNDFVAQRQVLLDAITHLANEGIVPTSDELDEELIEDLEIQCGQVKRGLQDLRQIRDELGSRMRNTISSKRRLQSSILRETRYGSAISVRA